MESAADVCTASYCLEVVVSPNLLKNCNNLLCLSCECHASDARAAVLLGQSEGHCVAFAKSHACIRLGMDR